MPSGIKLTLQSDLHIKKTDEQFHPQYNAEILCKCIYRKALSPYGENGLFCLFSFLRYYIRLFILCQAFLLNIFKKSAYKTKPLWFCFLYSWEFEVQPQVIIISGDLRDRNDLKSKVSTSEELYDFSLKKLKNHIL